MLKKWFAMFGIGGSVYVMLELLFRGRSHISMFIAGGLSTALIFSGCCVGRLRRTGWCLKCIIGSAIITAVEFCTGVIVNLWLRLHVWDYSSVPLNLLGQICLPFSVLWFFLTLPVLAIGNLLQKRISPRKSQEEAASNATIKRRNPAAPSSSER